MHMPNRHANSDLFISDDYPGKGYVEVKKTLDYDAGDVIIDVAKAIWLEEKKNQRPKIKDPQWENEPDKDWYLALSVAAMKKLGESFIPRKIAAIGTQTWIESATIQEHRSDYGDFYSGFEFHSFLSFQAMILGLIKMYVCELKGEDFNIIKSGSGRIGVDTLVKRYGLDKREE